MINAAIIGVGWWGKRIVQAVQGKSSLIRFTHAVLRHPEAIVDFAASHDLKVTTEFTAVLSDPAIDAVVLATPHSMHADQVIASATAGKHVFCEKPLALTRADADRAVQTCALHGRVLAVGENKRFWPSMMELREIIAKGELGEVLHMEAQASNQNSTTFTSWRHDESESPAGGMTGAGTKLLDGMVSIAGPISSLTAQMISKREGADPLDTVSVLFRFESGVSGVLCTVRSTPAYSRFHVFGDNASVEVLSDTELVIRSSGGKIERRSLPSVDSVRSELDAFALSIAGTAPYPISGADAVEVIAALEAIVTSIRIGRSVQLIDGQSATG